MGRGQRLLAPPLKAHQDARNTALESVQRCLDTVNGVFPDVSARRPST